MGLPCYEFGKNTWIHLSMGGDKQSEQYNVGFCLCSI